jgi:DNA-binding SARP family transcriptional activator
MFRLLGPLVLAAGDDEVAPATQKQRQMLAVLLLDCNKPVSLDRLSEELWGDSPPRSAVANLLRSDLVRAGFSGDRLATVRNGYLLRVESGERDLDRCEDLASQAATASRKRDFAEAARLLGEALALWRGPAFADVEASPALTARIHGIDERRLDLFEDLVEAHVRVGDARAMIMQLREHLAAHPLRERAHGQLMRVLYAQGDAAAALQAYQNAREILDAELGLDPGPDLTRLQQAILRREPIVDERPAAVVVPRQLPADITNLVGRDTELAALRDSSAAVRAVHGPGGVGKSALIIRLAHELAPDFPDGQLYVDLQGSNPRLMPLTPGEVLARFIRALAPSLQDIPAEPAEAAGLFRSIAAGRKILIVLDNAIETAQVRALLPGTSGCLVLVTGRRALTALADAHHLALGVLSEADALALLRVNARLDIQGARRLVAICGRLPLALRIAAARLAARPDWSGTDLAARLEDQRRILDELHVDDLELRACFEASYRALEELSARAFRLAGYLRVPHFSTRTLSALLDTDTAEAAAAADSLVEAGLLESDGTGYRFHDLLRAFAAERAGQEHQQRELDAGVRRVFGYFLATTRHAIEMHYGHRSPLTGVFREIDRLSVAEFHTTEEASSWLDSEWPNALAAAEQSATSTTLAYAAQLGRSAMHFLVRRFRYDEVARLAGIVLDGGQEVKEPSRAAALIAMGAVEKRTGNIAIARNRYFEAIEIREKIGDVPGLVAAWNGLAILERFDGNFDAAMSCFRASQELMHQSGDLHLEPHLLANVADLLADGGQLHEAIAQLRSALRSVEPSVQAGFKMLAFDSLGRLCAQTGEERRALRYFERALELAKIIGDLQIGRSVHLSRAALYLRMKRPDLALIDAERVRTEAAETGDVYRHAASLRLLGQVYESTGEIANARYLWRQADLLFKRLDRQSYERQVESYLAREHPTLPRPAE